MSSPRVITFRDSAVGPVLDPAKAHDLALLSVVLTRSAPAPGVTLSVHGIAKGLSAVNVAVRSVAAAQSVAAVLDTTTGLFAATLSSYPMSAEAAVSIEATDAAGRAKDRGAIAAPGVLVPDFPAAEEATGGRSRLFLGGNADRLVRSRSFCPIVDEAADPFPFDFLALGGLGKRPGRGRRRKEPLVGVGFIVAVPALIKRAKATVTSLRRQARDGDLSPAEFREARSEAYAEAAVALAGRWGAGQGDAFGLATPLADAVSQEAGSKRPGLRKVQKGKGPESQTAGLWAPVKLGSADQIRGAWRQMFATLLGQEKAPPIGVLFDDRLRFQPAGLMVGEEVSTLSLAPGEELQVRQTVETKRRTTLEEVTDRESERQVTLSSSWSTDITAALQETESSNQASRVGGDLRADLASVGIPVNVGGSATFDTSSAHSTTSDTSRADHLEATTSATARMRSQHKVRLEITTEDSTSLAATRTVRNPNPLRGCTYIFYKLYRKERVTLERYGARLCLALRVVDPARDTRAAFLDGIAKLDPDNPANYRAQVPDVVTAEWRVELDGDQAVRGRGERVDDESTRIPYTVGPTKLKGKSTVDDTRAVDATFMLLETPVIEIISFKDDDEEERHYGTNAFREYRHGNKAELQAPLPQVNAKDPEITIRTVVLDVFDVEARIVSRWGPDDATALAYATARASERETLLGALRLERILELRDVAVGQYTGVVLSRAVESHFRTTAKLTELAEIFDVKDIFVRNTPQWATQKGRRIYRDLRARVERLPIVINAEDVLPDELTASEAVVFLPVREGREADALALLKQFKADRARDVISDLESFRETSFPRADADPMASSDVLSPVPVAGTPLGDATWGNPWEEPPREFLVLAQWSEAVPTDGLHLEMLLTDTTVADEARVATLAKLEQI
jgi:hypothetical protein